MTLRYASLAAVFVLLYGLFIFAQNPQQPEIRIEQDDETRRIDCKNSAVFVAGDDNSITLQGECTRLTIAGDDNTITAATVTDVMVMGDDNKVSVDSVARVNTTGDDNQVTWKSGVGGKPPQVTNTGDDNVSKQADK